MELSDVIRRAWQDAEFKARLLNAPRETLEEALSVVLPPDLTVFIHEQKPTEVHLILPPPPDGGDEIP